MSDASIVEIAAGLWELRAVHPEWTESDDWEPEVAWWAASTDAGLLLIDPLLTDGWDWLDDQVQEAGGCAGIVRTVGWHERSVVAAAARYRTRLHARQLPAGLPADEVPSEHTEPHLIASDGESLAGGGAVTHWLAGADELAIWLPGQRALIFGDAMHRDQDGRLVRSPDSWFGAGENMRALGSALLELATLDPLHLLVGHGPLVTADGPDALRQALA